MITDYFPLLEDIKEEYTRERKHGKTRQESIDFILSEYHRELDDPDDGSQVWIGLAKTLAQKKELTPEIQKKAIDGADVLTSLFPEDEKELHRFKKSILNPENIGPEAKYSKKRIYKPNWKLGDTFIHKLMGDQAKEIGIDGCYAVVRKVGEEFDEGSEIWLQNVFITVCLEKDIPKTSKQLEDLGYLPLRDNEYYPKRGEEYYYLAQLWISSKIAENRFALEYIGCFPDVSPPKWEKRPQTEYKLMLIPFPREARDFLTQQVCWGYENYGIVKA